MRWLHLQTIARHIIAVIDLDYDLAIISQTIRDSYLNLDEYVERHRLDADPEAEAMTEISNNILENLNAELSITTIL